MTADHYLYRAQAALSCLQHLTCFYDEQAECPPENFGFGLSVILSGIGEDITAAYNECTKPGEAEK
jgi:hypothetical protein